MGFFTKTAPVPAPSCTDLSEQLSAKLTQRAERLEARKANVLSSFRRMVIDLHNVNAELRRDARVAESMIAACQTRIAANEQAYNDNAKVIESITAIIGEVPELSGVGEDQGIEFDDTDGVVDEAMEDGANG